MLNIDWPNKSMKPTGAIYSGHSSTIHRGPLAPAAHARPSARLDATRFQKSNLKRLMATIVVVAGAFLNLSLRACPIEGPEEKITLAHFWVVNVGDADFGVREWQCSGDASAGVPARTDTTVFVGWGEFSTRLSAFAVVSIAIVGVCAAGLLSGPCSALSTDRKYERPIAEPDA